MWKDKQARERFLFCVIAAVMVAAAAFAIVKGQRRPSPIVFNGLPNQPSVSLEPEKPNTEQELTVHVAGAVASPGLLRLKPGARVQDAVTAAGGATSEADLDQINLAAPVVDGSQVFVPRKGKSEEVAQVEEKHRGGSVAKRYSRNASPHSSAKKEAPAGQVNVNQASPAELQTLPGIGPSTAKKIIEYRQSHGPFQSVDELMAVKGIGPKKLSTLRKYLRL